MDAHMESMVTEKKKKEKPCLSSYAKPKTDEHHFDSTNYSGVSEC